MTQPMPPAGYPYPQQPQPPAPAQPQYTPPAPGYAPQQGAPAYAPPAPGYGPPAPGYEQAPPGYAPGYGPPAPGYAPGYAPPAPGYGPPAPGYGAPAQPPAPQLAYGTIDDYLNQPGGTGAENITKVFANKPFGSVTVSFLVARKILNTDIRQQTNAQNQPQLAFNGDPLYVMIVPATVIGSTDGSHAALFPDGNASWWVKGQPKDALLGAMSAAGVDGGVPEAGARIDLTLTGERAAKKAGHNPSKQYAVRYTRPATAPGQPQPPLDAAALQAPSAPVPAPQPEAPQQYAPHPEAPQQPAAPQYVAQDSAYAMATGQPPVQYAQAPQAPQQPPVQQPPAAPPAPVQYAQQPAPQYAQPPQAPPAPVQYAQAPAPGQYYAQPAAPGNPDLSDTQARLMAELRANGSVPPAPVG